MFSCFEEPVAQCDLTGGCKVADMLTSVLEKDSMFSTSKSPLEAGAHGSMGTLFHSRCPDAGLLGPLEPPVKPAHPG